MAIEPFEGPDQSESAGPVTTRRSASRIVHGTMVAARLPRLWRRLRPGAVVFCFHNVVANHEAGGGDASLHMGLGDFEIIIDWIRSTYDVVPLVDLVARVREGVSVQGLAALTFDDAYRGLLRHAVPLLCRAEVPATLFVVSDAPRRPEFFWWDRLAARGKLTEERRVTCLASHRGLGEAILTSVPGEDAVPELSQSLLPASWDEIRAGLDMNTTIGSHTARHPNLTALRVDEVRDELVGSRHEIREQTGWDPALICYPYGLYDDVVLREARRAGYSGGVTLRGGVVGAGEDPLELPRVNVPAGISPEALECWAAGLGFVRSPRLTRRMDRTSRGTDRLMAARAVGTS